MARLNGITQPELRQRITLANFGVVHSLVSSAVFTGTVFGVGYESIAIARTLAQTGQFANPYASMATGATAHLPPLYPALVAAFLRCFGVNKFAFVALSVVTALLFGYVVSSLPPFAEGMRWKRAVGLIAAVALLSLPVCEISLAWESVMVAAGLLCFCVVTYAGQRCCLLAGVIAAAVCLSNPVGVLFLGTWSVGLLWRKVWTPRAFVAAWLLCAALCFPWMLRNYFVLGSFCLRDDFGLELQVNNNDSATALLDDSFPAHSRYHPNLNRYQAAKLAAVTEPEYNSLKLATALQWIQAHPLRFLTLSGQRTFYFWFPPFRSGPFAAATWLLTILSIPSMVMAFQRRDLRALLVVSMFAYSLPYGLVNAELRYRTPVLWITALFAGETVYWLICRFRFSRVIPSSVLKLCLTENG